MAYQQSQELTELVSPLPAAATKAAQPAPFVHERSQWSAYAAKFGSLLLFVTVAAAPLPFGSNQPAPIALWCIVLGAALLFLPLRGLSGGQLALIGFGLFVVAAYALVLHDSWPNILGCRSPFRIPYGARRRKRWVCRLRHLCRSRATNPGLSLDGHSFVFWLLRAGFSSAPMKSVAGSL